MAVDPSTVQGLTYQDPFVVFFQSEYFLITLVLIVVTCITTPFAVKGAIEVGKWIDRHFIKPGEGYIWARQRMPNDRLRNFWLRPTGKMAKYTTVDGKEIEQPINLGKGWVVFDGNVPCIELDADGHQVYLGKDAKFKVNTTISQEEITRGYKAAYDTGKLMGAVDFFDEIKTWLLICMVMSVVGIVISAYFGYTVMSMISEQPAPTTSEIAEEVVRQMRNTTLIQQSANQAIPTVGAR